MAVLEHSPFIILMAVLDPMAVLRILPMMKLLELSAFIILMAVLEPLAGDEALGAFGHGEPSCRSNRWPVMQLLQILPDDEIIGSDGSLGAFGVHHPDGSLADPSG